MGSVASSVRQAPLVALLGELEAAFIAEFDARLKGSDFCALSLAHSRNVLRHLRRGPLRASAIVDRCSVSKQALSQQISYLESHGYVEVTPDPADQRARMVALTDKGAAAQDLAMRLFGAIEREWAADLDPGEVEVLRSLLLRLRERHGRGCGPTDPPQDSAG